MNTKTLYELGTEYLQQADILRRQIAALREKLRRISPLSKEAYKIKSVLSVLYRQRSEAVQTGTALINYYGREKTV